MFYTNDLTVYDNCVMLIFKYLILYLYVIFFFYFFTSCSWIPRSKKIQKDAIGIYAQTLERGVAHTEMGADVEETGVIQTDTDVEFTTRNMDDIFSFTGKNYFYVWKFKVHRAEGILKIDFFWWIVYK